VRKIVTPLTPVTQAEQVSPALLLVIVIDPLIK
jgi:hypothetical protein